MTEQELTVLKDKLESGFFHDPDLDKNLFVLTRTEAEAILSLLSKEQEGWISVEDRLPQYYKPVQCNTKNGIVIAWRASDGEKDIYTVFETDVVIETPSHWMPCPEPPVNDSAEKEYNPDEPPEPWPCDKKPLKSPRLNPCLCVSCPECDAVFMGTALQKEYHGDSESNKELLNQIDDYAREGYSVSFKESHEFKFHLCEHVKANNLKQ